jgi:hypothetical protein
MQKFRALRLFGLACVAGLVAACSDRPLAESPEVRFEREVAYRQACVARVLAQGAEEDLRVVEAALPADTPTDAVGQITQRATMAAFEFARAYQLHADLRATAYALVDSATNHADTSADSARYLERAGALSINLPLTGTLEANVLERYQNNMAAMLSNLDHPCNWDIPF